MTFRLPVITCPAEGYNDKNFQSQESGILESISVTILLKLIIVDLIGLLYL